MLKSILFRRENWLLVIPVFFLFSSNVFIGNSAIDIHLHDTYYVVRTLHVIAWILMLVVLPYLFHVFFRIYSKGNKRILNTHICITLVAYISMIAIAIFTIYKQSIRKDFGVSEMFEPNLSQYLFAAIAFIYFLNQFLFLIYFLVQMFFRKR